MHLDRGGCVLVCEPAASHEFPPLKESPNHRFLTCQRVRFFSVFRHGIGNDAAKLGRKSWFRVQHQPWEFPSFLAYMFGLCRDLCGWSLHFSGSWGGPQAVGDLFCRLKEPCIQISTGKTRTLFELWGENFALARQKILKTMPKYSTYQIWKTYQSGPMEVISSRSLVSWVIACLRDLQPTCTGVRTSSYQVQAGHPSISFQTMTILGF